MTRGVCVCVCVLHVCVLYVCVCVCVCTRDTHRGDNFDRMKRGNALAQLREARVLAVRDTVLHHMAVAVLRPRRQGDMTVCARAWVRVRVSKYMRG